MTMRRALPEQAGSPGRAAPSAARRQRGVSLLGLVFWAVVVAFGALLVMKVVPAINEFYTIKRAVDKVAKEGGTTVPEIRNAFERQKQIEYSISSISGSDLEITKVNDKIVLRFAYNKEIELIDPVFLVLKFRGESK